MLSAARSWLLATALFLVAGLAPGAQIQFSPIPSLITNEDTPTAPARITITGVAAERRVDFLCVSSNPLLVPDSNVRFSQAGNSRTLTITPTANQSGEAVLQILASDGSMTATQRVSLTVRPLNDSPTVSRISDQTIPSTATSVVVPFSVGDVETPCASLAVRVFSSKPDVLPNDALSLSGNGASRALTIRPVSGKSGKATVTVQASDGKTTTSREFTALLGTANRAPLVNAGADQTVIGFSAVLRGTATDDNPAGLLTRWEANTYSDEVTFDDPHALNSGVRFSRPGIYTLRLTASDGELAEGDEVTIVAVAPQFATAKARAGTRR